MLLVCVPKFQFLARLERTLRRISKVDVIYLRKFHEIKLDSVIFCEVHISMPTHGVVNNSANNNKLTTLAQCLRPCHVMTYLSCKPLVCKRSVFRDSHVLFITMWYLTVICNVLWLTICSFLLFCVS